MSARGIKQMVKNGLKSALVYGHFSGLGAEWKL
jgi:hypothetical protein